MLSYKPDSLFGLFALYNVGMGENNCRSILYLVIEKLAEVLHIHLALAGINNNRITVEFSSFGFNALNCADNVGKFTNTRRLDYNSVRIIFFKNLGERRRKISYKGATDTTRVHLGYLNACFS